MINDLPPYLTDDEISDICMPLVKPSAQRKYLKDELGFLIKEKPNGRPLVARSEFERVMGAARFDAQSTQSRGPDVTATRERWAAKRGDHGTQTQGR